MAHYHSENEKELLSKKIKSARWYITRYKISNPCDIYCWLREGEYGRISPELSLDRLINDVHLARQQQQRQTVIWEPAGMALTRVRINLIPYVNFGCPLKRLLMLEERTSHLHPNPLQLKEDWAIVKQNMPEESKLTAEDLTEYEYAIPFHTIPEVSYSEEFSRVYGRSYRLVPRRLFFEFFPEYKIEEEEFFTESNEEKKEE